MSNTRIRSEDKPAPKPLSYRVKICHRDEDGNIVEGEAPVPEPRSYRVVHYHRDKDGNVVEGEAPVQVIEMTPDMYRTPPPAKQKTEDDLVAVAARLVRQNNKEILK